MLKELAISLALMVATAPIAVATTTMTVTNDQLKVTVTGDDPNAVYCEAEDIRSKMSNSVIHIPGGGSFYCDKPQLPMATFSTAPAPVTPHSFTIPQPYYGDPT